MAVADAKPARAGSTDKELEIQLNSIRSQMRKANENHEVLKRMRDNLRRHEETIDARMKQQIEADLLNEYNYLRLKTRKESVRAKASLSNSLNLTSHISDISGISGQSEYDRLYLRWERVIKSGLEENHSALNPCAVALLPKEDLGLKTIKRLEKALKDLTNMPKGFQSGLSQLRAAQPGKKHRGSEMGQALNK